MQIYQRAIVEQVLKGGTFRCHLQDNEKHAINALSLRKHAQKPNRPLCRRRGYRRTQPGTISAGGA